MSMTLDFLLTLISLYHLFKGQLSITDVNLSKLTDVVYLLFSRSVEI